MSARGEFRPDLFYRLGGARIHLPPLRQRGEDIVDLVSHYWRQFTARGESLPGGALEMLRSHDWPGNVRELLSVLRRLALFSRGSPTTEDVRTALQAQTPRRLFSASIFETRTHEEVLRLLEEAHLEYLHQKHAGSLARIASELGTSTRSVYRRFEKLNLRPGDWKRRAPEGQGSS
jgi:DNA-binding NtrC family response regulator